MFAKKTLVVLGLFSSLLALSACGKDTDATGGDSKDKGGSTGTTTDGGTAAGNTLTGATAFDVKSAVVLWWALGDGGVDRSTLRVMMTNLDPATACEDARNLFTDHDLTLKGHDVTFFGASGTELAAGAYPVTNSPTGSYAQELYWDVSNDYLLMPTAQISDGGVTIDAITWPTSIAADLVQGGSVRGTFNGALEFGGDEHDSVGATFLATGCDQQTLVP